MNGSYPLFGLLASTIHETTATAKIEPQKSPATGLLTRWNRETLKPQMNGQNCEYTIALSTTAWMANAKSLKRTVGSGETG